MARIPSRKREYEWTDHRTGSGIPFPFRVHKKTGEVQRLYIVPNIEYYLHEGDPRVVGQNFIDLAEGYIDPTLIEDCWYEGEGLKYNFEGWRPIDEEGLKLVEAWLEKDKARKKKLSEKQKVLREQQKQKDIENARRILKKHGEL